MYRVPGTLYFLCACARRRERSLFCDKMTMTLFPRLSVRWLARGFFCLHCARLALPYTHTGPSLECARRRRVIFKRDVGTVIDARKISHLGEEAWLAQACADITEGSSEGSSGDLSAARSRRFARRESPEGELMFCSSPPVSCDTLTVQPLPVDHSITKMFFQALPELEGHIVHPTLWGSRNVSDAHQLLQRNNYVTLRRLISDEALHVASGFALSIVQSGSLPQQDAMTTRHHFVNDTLSRFLQIELTLLVERLVDQGQLTLSHTYLQGMLFLARIFLRIEIVRVRYLIIFKCAFTTKGDIIPHWCDTQ